MLVLITILCLGAYLAGWVSFALPSRVERSFGPPAANLDFVQRLRLSLSLLLQENGLKSSRDPQGTDRPFQVQLGDSTFAITNRLQAEGLIADAQALRDYMVYAGLDTTIQAGEYTLSPRMTAVEIAHAMQDATPSEVVFRILPGWRREEIAAALPTSGLSFTPGEFLARVAAPPPAFTQAESLPPRASLEGFLYPDSYRLSRQISLDDFIATLLEDFQAKLTYDIRQGFQQQELDLFQAVTLASMVQREAIVEDEMPLIASVFLNRMVTGMKLDSDPTVQYSLGYNKTQGTWWTNPLSAEDLQINSPYNTYLNSGLPLGPISNPGLSALQAVAFPAQTPYFFFRAACDGSGRHSFAKTFQEHQQNACP